MQKYGMVRASQGAASQASVDIERGADMTRRIGRRAIAVAIVAIVGLAVLVTPARASVPTAPTSAATGSFSFSFGPSYVQQMFKAGVFIYGASEVSVSMSDSMSLTARVPVNGASTATPTSSIQVDGEVGGIEFFNGPGATSAGMNSFVIRRTGSTGSVTGTLVGPFTKENGQFSETMPLFTLSSVRTTKSNSGWTMTAKMALTDRGASTLNTLLTTTFFKAGVRVGSFDAEVTGG